LGLSLLGKSGLSVACLGIGLWLTHSAVGASIGLIVAWTAVLLLFDIPRACALGGSSVRGTMSDQWTMITSEKSGFNRVFKSVRRLLSRSLALGFGTAIQSLNPNIVLYFARVWVSEAQFGVFGGLQYIAFSGDIVMNAVGLSISPRMARSYAAGDARGFRSLVLRLLVMAGVLGGVGVAGSAIAGNLVISLLLKPQWSDDWPWLVGLAAASMIAYLASALWYAAVSTRRFHRFTVPYLLATFVAVVASAALIPTMGLAGTILSFATIYSVLLASFAWILWVSPVGSGSQT